MLSWKVLLASSLLAGAALAGCVTPPEEVPASVVDEAPVAPATTGTQGVAYQATPGLAARDDAGALLSPPVVVEPPFPLPVGILRKSPMSSFEPTVGVTSDGSVFLSTFDGATPKRTLLQRSTDQGLTWTDVTPQIASGSFPPQSNDPYVYVDPITDRIYLSDLQALICSTLSWSDDGGETWTSSPVGCGLPFGVQDHQTVFAGVPRQLTTVGYDNVVYYCINRVGDSSCASSVNGGLTFGPLRTVYTGVQPSSADPGAGLPAELCGGLHAHGTTAPDGTVYLPKGHCGAAMVAISKDDGLTWEVVDIGGVPSPGHEVAFAVDEAGHAYAFWMGPDDLPYLAISSDDGHTWREPIMVAPPDVGVASWPTIAAGADGRVAMAYYGTKAVKEFGDMGPEDTWNAYITIVADAQSETPTISTVTVNDPSDPVARGVCGGGRCNGVGDFIDIVIDAEGRPWAALVDVCNDACAEPDGTQNEGAVGFVGTLAAGPRLRGVLEALPALMAVAPEA